MRDLLFVSHRIPYPPNKGEKIRAWHQILHLSKTWRVHLATLIDDPADWQHLEPLRAVCASVRAAEIDRGRQKWLALLRCRPGRPLMPGYYWHPDLQAWINKQAASRSFELVFAYTAAVTPLVARVPAPKLLDMLDVDSLKWADYARNSRFPLRAVWAREARTLLRFERAAVLRHDRSLFVSKAERDAFAALAPEAAGRIDWVQNGVDLQAFNPDRDLLSPFTGQGPHLVFTGHMDYRPNADAVIWFARQVLPRLRRTWPDVTFHIVGANPGPDVLALRHLPGVAITGRVPEVQPYLLHAALSVSPLRLARGIQNKVLEAMAMGRPVVASPQAAEGIDALPGRDLLIADGAEAMAETISSVLAGQHPGLGTAARALVERRYAWSAVLQRLDAQIDRVLSAGHKQAA